MKRKHLYRANGTPKRIRCYMYKGKDRPIDYITVVFTYACHAGFPQGSVQYRAMNENPYHPAYGFCQWGEAWQWNFKAGGSRVNFSDLPEDCKEIVRYDYKSIWEEEDIYCL